MVYASFYSNLPTGLQKFELGGGVSLDNMAEDAVAASASLRQILTVSFVIAAQLLWVDCKYYGTHWRRIPSCSDSVSRRNSGLKFHLAARVSVVSVFPGTRVSVGPDEGTAVFRWTWGQLDT